MATKFITVSIEIMHDKNLTPNQKFILAEIEQLSELEKGCIASNKHFSELVGIKVQGVSNAINDLEKKGYINIDNSKTVRNYGRVITIHDNVSTIHSNVHTIHSNVESKENKTINKTKRVQAPTLEEIKEYIKEKQLSVDANKFFNYFEAGNWIDAKGNKVKNWKQKLLTWDNHSDKKNTDTKPKGKMMIGGNVI